MYLLVKLHKIKAEICKKLEKEEIKTGSKQVADLNYNILYMFSQIQFMCFYEKVEYTGICKKRNLQEIGKNKKQEQRQAGSLNRRKLYDCTETF